MGSSGESALGGVNRVEILVGGCVVGMEVALLMEGSWKRVREALQVAPLPST